jgi:hypothetical protein
MTLDLEHEGTASLGDVNICHAARRNTEGDSDFSNTAVRTSNVATVIQTMPEHVDRPTPTERSTICHHQDGPETS